MDSIQSLQNLNRLTILEILNELAVKIDNFDNVSQETKDLIEWIKNEGLTNEVNKFISNGKIYDVLNEKILNMKANKNEVRFIKDLININDLDSSVLNAITGNGSNFTLESIPKDGSVSIAKTNFIEHGNNMLDISTLINGYLNTDSSTDSVVENTTYKTTPYIKVTGGETIRLDRITNNVLDIREIRKARFYDSNRNLIRSYDYDNSNNIKESIGVPPNSKYMRVSILSGYCDGNSMLHKSTKAPSKFEPYSYCLPYLTLSEFTLSQIKNIENKGSLYGKTIVGFGDSIMYGAGSDGKGIVNILADKNGMAYENKGVSGATIMKTTANNIPSQIENYNGVADYVILEGYINDCFDDITEKLGSVSPNFGGSFNTNTFCGQLEEMLRTALNKFVGSKIIYVCPHTMSSRNNEIVKSVHSKVIECCNKWGVPVVDLYSNGILNTFIESHSVFTKDGDKTHPTIEGYKKYYIPQIETMLKSL